MGILEIIVVGFIVGLIARMLKPGRDAMGFIMTTVLGIVGAVVAGYLGQAFGIYQVGEPAGFVGAIIGAIVVLMIYEAAFGRQRSSLV